MARYMSTQYPSKNSGHQRKGEYKWKEGGDPKSKDKNNDATGTAGVNIGDVTKSEDSNALSGGGGIGAHFSEAIEQLSWPTRSVENLFAAHSINDAI